MIIYFPEPNLRKAANISSSVRECRFRECRFRECRQFKYSILRTIQMWSEINNEEAVYEVLVT